MRKSIVTATSMMCIVAGIVTSRVETPASPLVLPDRIDINVTPEDTLPRLPIDSEPPRMRFYTAPTHDDRLSLEPLEPQVIEMQRDRYGACGEFHDEAMAVGWLPSEWKRLSHIIARETGNTCDPGVVNKTEATRDLSYGLTQINMRGKLGPDRMSKCGLSAYEDLYDPKTNLACARTLYLIAGWEPWAYTPK